jgi:hypothetical protein
VEDLDCTVLREAEDRIAQNHMDDAEKDYQKALKEYQNAAYWTSGYMEERRHRLRIASRKLRALQRRREAAYEPEELERLRNAA